MAKIWKDAVGVYVRAGGYYFRPDYDRGTRFKEGDKAKARHVAGTPWARVEDEIWRSFGPWKSWHDADPVVIPSESARPSAPYVPTPMAL